MQLTILHRPRAHMTVTACPAHRRRLSSGFQVLSGPSLMMSYDVTPVRWFLQQLSPSSMNVFWSSRRHKGHTDSNEPFYGAHYTAEPLPQSWLDAFQAYAAVDASSTTRQQQQTDVHRASAAESQQQQQQQQQDGVQQQFVPLPGQLYLPLKNWAIPTDFELRPQEAKQPAGPAAAAAAAEAAGAAAADSVGGAQQPDSIVQQRGLCVWHKQDTSYSLPKVCTIARQACCLCGSCCASVCAWMPLP
jgi:secreted Zn-dependent insulinase-like peptidase